MVTSFGAYFLRVYAYLKVYNGVLLIYSHVYSKNVEFHHGHPHKMLKTLNKIEYF